MRRVGNGVLRPLGGDDAVAAPPEEGALAADSSRSLPGFRSLAVHRTGGLYLAMCLRCWGCRVRQVEDILDPRAEKVCFPSLWRSLR